MADDNKQDAGVPLMPQQHQDHQQQQQQTIAA
jgi:hypothetical protein